MSIPNMMEMNTVGGILVNMPHVILHTVHFPTSFYVSCCCIFFHFIVPPSNFTIIYSSGFILSPFNFIVYSSIFIVPLFNFIVHSSSYMIPLFNFIVYSSSFMILLFNFIVYSSILTEPLLNFIVFSSNFIVSYSIFCLWLFFHCQQSYHFTVQLLYFF